MLLDDRSANLTKELINNPGIKSRDLEEKFGLSRRQVSYSFEKINDWLKSNGLPIIAKNRQGVFLVSAKLLTVFQEKNEKKSVKMYIASETERIDLILLLLLSRSEEISLLHLTSALMVSKNTILSDLKIAQKKIANSGLEITYSRQDGYCIKGTELDKRKILQNVVCRILSMYRGANWLQYIANVSEEDIAKLKQRMENIENKLSLKFTDEKMESTTYTLALILRRIAQGKQIDSFQIDYKEFSDTNEYKAAEELLIELKNIPKEERLFITLQLLTTNVSSSELLTNEAIPELIQAIQEVLTRFEALSCTLLQDKEQLMGKFLLHMKPAYYRIKYRLTLSNSLQDTFLRYDFQDEFQDLHHLVKKCLQPLEKLIGCNIPEAESGYITILIGGWIKKQGDSISHKVKALVVCPNGVSISKLMQITLKELFPEFIFMDAISVREFKKYQHDYDLVFSSVYLQTDKKLYIINPVLKQLEKQRVRKQVMQDIFGYSLDNFNLEEVMQIVEKHAVIKDYKVLYRELQNYFTTDFSEQGGPRIVKPQESEKPHLCDLVIPEVIVIGKNLQDWEAAIRLAAEPLIKNNSIASQYIENIITRYHRQMPHIIFGTDIAIPHGIPEDGVHKVAMSLLRLETGVQFSMAQPIRIIVLVAASDKDMHLRALLQLSKLSENKKDIRAILNAKNEEKIYQVLKKYTD